MCNYAGSFVLVTWVVSRCAVKLIIDVGARRLGAWQGLSVRESKMQKWSYAKGVCASCIWLSFIYLFFIFLCNREYMQSLWLKEFSSSLSLLRPHFPICHRSTSFQLSPFFLSSVCLHWPFGPACLSRTEAETMQPRGSILRDLKLFSPEQRLVLSESTVAIQFLCHPSFYRVLLWRSNGHITACLVIQREVKGRSGLKLKIWAVVTSTDKCTFIVVIVI